MDERFVRGVELLSIRTLRDEMAKSGQFQLAAGGQMQLAAHTQATGLDNGSLAMSGSSGRRGAGHSRQYSAPRKRPGGSSTTE